MNEHATGGPTLPIESKRRIDSACLEFEAAWKAGQRPQIERYLTIPAEQRPALFRELLFLELEYRDRAGEQFDAEEYQRRFPGQAELIEEVFRSESEYCGVAPPGTRVRYFGGYELLEEIARGGMGIVYKARQVSLNRIVALKLVLAGQFASEEELERFRREAEAAANLQHPNIVAIHEVGQHDGNQYFSMAFVQGQSLAQMIRENPLPAVKAAHYVETIARAVEYAHQQGTLHRDLKPANILIDRDDQPRITDFGLARRVDADSDLTKSGQILGSPSYMPPEQASGRLGDVGPRSDVYALGAVLYDLVAGRPPFKAETATDTLLHVLHSDPVSVRALNPTVPRDLETICLKCLEKDPQRRYSSAAELSKELGRFLTGKPIYARPVTLPGRVWRWCRRNPAISALAAGLVVALLAGIVGIALAAQNESHQRRKAEQAADQRRRLLYVADMSVAQQAWEAGNVERVVELLKRHQPLPREEDLRGFQWRYLQHMCDGNVNSTVLSPGGAVWGVAFSPDGKTLASVGFDHPVKLWDVETGQERQTLGLPGQGVSVAFSPVGRILAVSFVNTGMFPSRELTLWDLNSGVTSTLPWRDAAMKMAFSPDGDVLATCLGSKVQLWDVKTFQQLRDLDKHKDSPVWAVAFAPDGKTLVSASDREVILWVLDAGAEPYILSDDAACGQCVAFAPDGKTLAAGSPDGKVWIWNTDRRALEEILSGQIRGGIWSLAFSSDGRLAAGSWDGTIALWKVSNGKEQDVLKGHKHLVFALEFSPDDSLLASGSWDGTARLWDVSVRRPPDVLEGQSLDVAAVAFSPDGSTVASASCDGAVRLWDVQTSEELAIIPAHQARVTSLAISSDGRLLATAGWDDTVRLWDISTGRQRASFNKGMPYSVAFSPDRTILASGGGQNSTADLWNVAAGQRLPLSLGYHAHCAAAVAVSPDGRTLATGSWDKTVKLWGLDTGTCLRTLEGHRAEVNCVSFSPDGRSLASGAVDNTVMIWEVDTGRRQETLEGHASAVNSVVFAPIERIVASGASDRTVKLWYLDTAKQPETLSHDAPVTSVMFSPDGNILASASGTTVRLWRNVGENIDAGLEALVMLERRARAIADADAKEQQQILDDLVDHLASRLPEGLLQRDIILAGSTARGLRESNNHGLAEEAFRSFGEVIAESKDKELRRLAESWEAAAPSSGGWTSDGS